MSDEQIEDFLLQHAPVNDVLDFVIARDDVRRIGVPLVERVWLEDAPIPTLRSRCDDPSNCGCGAMA